MDYGFYLGKTEGLFCKNRSEGVWLDLSRRIEIGQCRSDGRGRETASMAGGAIDGDERRTGKTTYES